MKSHIFCESWRILIVWNGQQTQSSTNGPVAVWEVQPSGPDCSTAAVMSSDSWLTAAGFHEMMHKHPEWQNLLRSCVVWLRVLQTAGRSEAELRWQLRLSRDQHVTVCCTQTGRQLSRKQRATGRSAGGFYSRSLITDSRMRLSHQVEM